MPNIRRRLAEFDVEIASEEFATEVGIRFMPTGGVTTANAADYLALKEVAAVGGTWLGKADDIKNGNWDGIAAAVALKNEL